MLPDGVFLNLPEDLYFAEPRMGSTDISRLYLQGCGWWWKSDHNPDKVDEPTDAKEFGKGLHAKLLEGDDAYKSRIAIFPDKNEERKKHGDKFCVTSKDIFEALEKRSFNPKGNSTKDFLIEFCRTRAPDLVLWDNLEKEWEKANAGKTKVTAAEDRQIGIMVDAVREHPDVGQLFQFGPGHIPLSEVSVFWTDEWGLKRRGRLDQMLPQTTVDVKTFQNANGRPLKYAVGEHLAKFAYQVQMADHHIARKMAYRFITEGRVFNGYDPLGVGLKPCPELDKFEREAAWIKRFPTEAPHWDYAWIFFQKPDAKKGIAPIIFPWGEDYADPDASHIGDLHRRGIRCWMQGIQTYREYMKRFGPDVPWTNVQPLHTSDENARMNRVFLPSYVGGDEPLAGENEFL